MKLVCDGSCLVRLKLTATTLVAFAAQYTKPSSSSSRFHHTMSQPNREDIQKKAFIRFLNTLIDADSKISSLDELTDGVILIKSLETLTSKSFSYTSKCRNIFQKLENINIVLKYLQNDCNVRLVNIDANMISQNNHKIILALIWHIILYFKIARAFSKDGKGGKSSKRADDSSASKEMMNWLNEHLPGGEAKNFTEDWKDGHRLRSVIMELRQHIDPNLDKRLVGNTPVELNNTCIDYAEESMNIPKLLSGEDIAEFPDKLAMMTYLSYFREYQQKEDENPTPVQKPQQEDPSQPHTCPLSDSLKEEVEKLKKQLEAVQQENKQLQEDNSKIKQEHQKEKEHSEVLQKDMDKYKKDIQDLETHNEALKQNQKKEEERAATLQKDLDTYKQNADQSNTDVELLKEERRQQQEKEDALKKELHDLKHNLNEVEQNLKEQQNQNQQLEERTEALNKQLAESEREVQQLKEKDEKNAALLQNQLDLVKRTIAEVEKQNSVQKLHDEIDQLREEKEKQLLGAQHQLQQAQHIIEQQETVIREFIGKLGKLKEGDLSGQAPIRESAT